MFTGWRDMLATVPSRNKREFVSVDARLDDLKETNTRSYEMLSRDSGKHMDESVTPSVVTPISPVLKSPLRSPSSVRASSATPNNDGRRTPDYFGHTARYHAPTKSFSSPRPPQQVTWDARDTYASPNPYSTRPTALPEEDEYVHPLSMNRI